MMRHKRAVLQVTLVISLAVFTCFHFFKETFPNRFSDVHALKFQCLEKVHENRVSHLKTVCNDLDNTDEQYKFKGPYEFFLQERYNFTFCKIQKTGSTFWMLLFHSLSLNKSLSSEFGSKSRFVLHSLSEKYKTSIHAVQKSPRRPILTVRNPFVRLYSAYLDRIYLPFDWQTSQTVSGLGRSGCPSNVTFQQFLDYVITTVYSGKELDIHWTPMTSRCYPCFVQPDVVMKTETFSDDVTYVLDKYGISLSDNKYLSEFLYEHSGGAVLPAIIEELDDRLSHGRRPQQNTILKCMSVMQVAERAWKTFQFQGYLSIKAHFPQDRLDRQATSLKSLRLMHFIRHASLEHPLTMQEANEQRMRTIKEAYSHVTSDTIKHIQTIYKLDFLIFNYNFEPNFSGTFNNVCV